MTATRHLRLDEWSRQGSVLHRRDARAKLVTLLILLVAVSRAGTLGAALVATALALGTGLAGLPLGRVLAWAALSIPFACALALAQLAAGRGLDGALVVVRTFLAAWCAILLVGTTPLANLLDGARRLGAPESLTAIVLVLNRSLFSTLDEVGRIRRAAASRGMGGGARQWRWRVAAAMVTGLFGRSLARAERRDHALRSRGFVGRLPVTPAAWGVADTVVLAAATGLAVAVGWERLWAH